MSNTDDDGLGLPDHDLDALSRLLDPPAVWAEPDPGLEDRVVAAIAAESDPGVDGLRHPPAPGRAERRHLWVIGAAGMLLLALAVGIGLGLRDGDDPVADDIEVALAGTDLAPGASAVAELRETPQGLRVLLTVTGLDPAPPGTYYQGWMRRADDGVSIGTFHLRGGDGTIELWGGVPARDYPVMTVSLQQEGGGPASSGQVVLRGELDS